jgi:hypothetical protein
MKLFVTVLALAVLALAAVVADVAVANAAAKTVKADNRGPFYSHAQGYQAHENPDRVFGTGNEPAAQ